MFVIASRRDVWRVTILVVSFALLMVTATLITLYPAEEWLWEISVSWPLTTVLAGCATYMVTTNSLKVHALNEELQRLVSRDRLTDVATRDFFFDRMQDQPDAYGISLMVDIDFFKRVNDTYGHLTGDKVIAHVAGILQGEVRDRDIVCRFGGEEFVIFLAEADTEAGAAMAERLRASVATSPVDDAGTTLSVTVSIGGSLKDATEHIDFAIQRADEALYRAKKAGRNQVWMHTIGNRHSADARKTA